LVAEADAPPRTREIFAEVRDALGVPAVPLLYQAYAVYPAFLDAHWQAFAPALRSRQFFQMGARLAAESYTRAHNYFAIRDLGSRALPQLQSATLANLPLSGVLDYYQYLDPLLLIVTAAQMQAFEGPAGGEDGSVEPPTHPTFFTAPSVLQDREVSPTVLRAWEERRRLVEVAFVSDEHRALAAWPTFYQEYWRALRELVQSPLYNDCQYRISESAWTLTSELPVRVETSVPSLLEAGLSEEEVSSVVHINETLVHSLSGLVLDITFARIACEGGTAQPREVPREPPVPRENTGSPTRAA
jgi:hypothetical protein